VAHIFVQRKHRNISIQRSTTNSNLESTYSRPKPERPISGFPLTYRSIIIPDVIYTYSVGTVSYLPSAKADVFGLPIGYTTGHDPSYPS
jgi:hypothetical protein